MMKIRFLLLLFSIFTIGMAVSCSDNKEVEDYNVANLPDKKDDSAKYVSELKGPKPIARWTFDNPNLILAADTGKALAVNGKIIPAKGLLKGDGAIEVRKGNYLVAQHGIKPKTASNKVEEYTLMMDIKFAEEDWKAIYSTHLNNKEDGECFIDPNGGFGISSRYSEFKMALKEWYRFIITVDLANKKIDYYTDGELRFSYPFNANEASLDSRFSLSESLLFFADDNEEDGNLTVSDIAIWDRSLTAAEVKEIGGYKHIVKPPTSRDPQGRIGRWLFDDSANLEKATFGGDFEIIGSCNPAAGPTTTDKAADVPKGSYLKADLSKVYIRPNGDGMYVNQYTIQFDLSFPNTGEYKSLFHTSDSEQWGQSYISNTEGLGLGSNYSTAGLMEKDKWYRIVITADLAAKKMLYYIDGILVYYLPETDVVLDGQLALREQLHFFRDKGGSDGDVRIAEISLWDKTLSSTEVKDLGGFGNFAQVANPVGKWTFDDTANPLKATFGRDLVLKKGDGTAGVHTLVEGPTATNKAIKITEGNYYWCEHMMPASLGGARVNEYTYMCDVKFDNDLWKSFYQVQVANTVDASFWIHDNGSIGVANTGYSGYKLVQDEWYRVVATFKFGTGDTGEIKYYVDGKLIHTGTKLDIDNARLSLDPTGVLLFGDESGDDGPIMSAEVAFWNRVLTPAEVTKLGGYEHIIPKQ